MYNYPMGGAASLISRPHHRDFLCTKTNHQKSRGGGGGGVGIDCNRNWQRREEMWALKNSQIIVNDWTTFETIIQDRKTLLQPMWYLKTSTRSRLLLAWTILFSLGCDDRVWTSAKQTDYKHSTKTNQQENIKKLSPLTLSPPVVTYRFYSV